MHLQLGFQAPKCFSKNSVTSKAHSVSRSALTGPSDCVGTEDRPASPRCTNQQPPYSSVSRAPLVVRAWVFLLSHRAQLTAEGARGDRSPQIALAQKGQVVGLVAGTSVGFHPHARYPPLLSKRITPSAPRYRGGASTDMRIKRMVKTTIYHGDVDHRGDVNHPGMERFSVVFRPIPNQMGSNCM